MFDLESIKRYRLENFITQEELANKINTSPSYVCKVENNYNINPSLSNIIKIAEQLDVCPSVIMSCNCVNCKLKTESKARLKCKKRTLDTLKGYLSLSNELVEYEINNYGAILEEDLTFGDISYLRKIK